MADCESKGISKDTCYLAEQNRQASITNAAEAAALQNAAKQYPAKQYAQAAHKTVKTHLAGLDIVINAQQQMYVDGKPALITEQNKDATVYQQGVFNIIHYTRTHKLFVMQNGKIIGKGKV